MGTAARANHLHVAFLYRNPGTVKGSSNFIASVIRQVSVVHASQHEHRLNEPYVMITARTRAGDHDPNWLLFVRKEFYRRCPSGILTPRRITLLYVWNGHMLRHTGPFDEPSSAQL